MDMSKAALPAISGNASPADSLHPLYKEWVRAEASNRRNMINGQNFRDWLYQREQQETNQNWVKHPQYPAFLVWMRETKAGGRGNRVFPENFKAWMNGERW